MSRAGDIGLLRTLLARDSELREGEAEAFESMLTRLEDERRPDLTENQKRWVVDAAGRLEIDDPEDDPAARNANVPRGREVPVPAVLQHLPKSPPGRKARI